MRLVLILLLLSVLTFVRADFDDDDLEDVFTRIIGDEDDCPRLIEFEDDDLTLDADDVEVNDRECTGGQIRLTENPSNTNATRYFRDRRDRVGDFLAGRVSGNLRCGDRTIDDDEEIIFVETDRDISFTWRDVFGKETELGRRRGGVIEFDDDTKYMILGEKCLYREANIFERVCFPANAVVTTRDGQKKMEELEIGDEVYVGNGQFSAVFGFTHRDPNGKARYVKIEAEGGFELVATEGHFVYADGEPIMAKQVQAGQMMETGDGREVMVEKVGRVQAKGLYNPQTVHGDIVVDGLRATTYTKAVEMNTAHSLLAPFRALWSVSGWGLSVESIA